MKLISTVYIIFCLFFFTNTKLAYAYLALGPLIPIIGNIIVFIFIGIVAILGFLAYPIKKLIDKKKKKKKKLTKKKNRNNKAA